jgi:outer membrane receptor protein involved in Fe transport
MSAIIDATAVRPADPRYFEIRDQPVSLQRARRHAIQDGRGHALVSARAATLATWPPLSENDFGEAQYSDGFARVDYEMERGDEAQRSEMLVSSVDRRARQGSGRAKRARPSIATSIRGHCRSRVAERRSDAGDRLLADLENRRQGDVNEPGVRTAQVHDERLFHVIGLRVENNLDVGIFEHRFGAEVRRLWGDYDYASEVHVLPGFPFPGSPGFDTARVSEPSPDGYESSAYWDVRAQFNDRWALQGGVRIDTQTYDGSDDGEQWSPRLGVLYTLSPQTQLRAASPFRAVQGINELQVEDGVDTFTRRSTRITGSSAWIRAFAAGLDLRVEAFVKDYRRINPRFESIFDPAGAVAGSGVRPSADRAAERPCERHRNDGAVAGRMARGADG